MESNKTSIKIDGDASGLENAAKKAKASIKELNDTTREAKKTLKETSSAFDEIGGAIGGVTGKFANMASTMMTATGAISLVVLGIEQIASAWEKSQKNVDEYLKSRNKVLTSSVDFKALAQTQYGGATSRAEGEWTLGNKQLDDAQTMIGLTKEQSIELQKNGQAHIANSILLKNQLGIGLGVVENARKRNQLLFELEALNKRAAELAQIEIKYQEELAILDTEKLKIFNAIKDKKTEEDKTKLLEDYRAKLKEIADFRAKDENEQYENKKKLLDIQGLSEESAMLTLNHNKTLVEIYRDYEQTLVKGWRLESSITQEKDKQVSAATALLKKQREIIQLGESGAKIGQTYYDDAGNAHKSGMADVSMSGLKSSTIGTWKPDMSNTGIQKYGGTSTGEIAQIVSDNKLTDNLKEMPKMIDLVSSSFNKLGASIHTSMGAWISYIGNIIGTIPGAISAITALIATKNAEAIANTEVAATGAAASVAAIPIIGPLMAIAAVASVLVALANIPKFADGTNFAPGGLALVGERGPELVNLPRGSQVIPNGSEGRSVRLHAVLTGRDIYLSGMMHQDMLNNNT
jgi:hypothetical protein